LNLFGTGRTTVISVDVPSDEDVAAAFGKGDPDALRLVYQRFGATSVTTAPGIAAALLGHGIVPRRPASRSPSPISSSTSSSGCSPRS
jgi:hypothetical protein